MEIKDFTKDFTRTNELIAFRNDYDSYKKQIIDIITKGNVIAGVFNIHGDTISLELWDRSIDIDSVTLLLKQLGDIQKQANEIIESNLRSLNLPINN